MIVFGTGSSALKLALLFLFSFSCFVLYGRLHFFRDPGSAFYDPARAYDQQYSALRLNQIESFRNNVKFHGSEAHSRESTEGAKPEICATITTFSRPDLERQYVEDTIFSVLDSITPQERASLHLSVLFTDLDATLHPSWSQPWLRTLLDDVWSYGDESAELRSWLEDVGSTQIKTKAIMDYTLALQKCLDHTDAPYVAVFEGDTLFAAGWVAPTLLALRSVDSFMQQRASSQRTEPEHARDWLDLRLFNQERSTGWASDEIGGNNELMIVLLINTVIGLAILLFRSRHIISPHSVDNPTLAVILLLIVPVSVVSFFRAGKASLLAPRPGLAVENFGCCSQALLFNRRHVPGLIGYLRDFAVQEANGTSGHLNYDMRTKDFARRNGLDRLALYPMQVQHMGIKSAMGTSQAEAQSVWSMAFEYLKEADVRTRHDNAMDELFGREWRTVKPA